MSLVLVQTSSFPEDRPSSRFDCKMCRTPLVLGRVEVKSGSAVRYFGCRSCDETREITLRVVSDSEDAVDVSQFSLTAWPAWPRG